MNITHKQRKEFLEAYNNLRTILQSIHECQDIWMSDIRKLESMEWLMRRTMKFVPHKDDEGNSMWYSDWVLEDLSVDPDGEQPDV